VPISQLTVGLPTKSRLMHGTAPLKSLMVSASLMISAKFEAWAAQSRVSSGACLLTRKHANHNGRHELRLVRDAGLRVKNNNNFKNEQKNPIFFSFFPPHRLAGHPFLADSRLRGREGEESGENDKSKHCSSFFFFDVLTRLFSKGSPCLESRTRDFQTDLIC
jgi:hypothetical protein